MSNGIFVAVDGPDGVGKSRIVSEVCNKLKASGHDVLLTKEVSSGPIGALIKNNEFNSYILANLVAADRLYHIENEILPALDNGKIVISDRYVASSYVCQQLDGVPLDFIKSINSLIISPDLSIFILADVEIISDRLSERPRLARMEKISTHKMISLYNQAAVLFKENNYGKILELKNNNKDDLNNNIEIIYREIMALLGDTV